MTPSARTSAQPIVSIAATNPGTPTSLSMVSRSTPLRKPSVVVMSATLHTWTHAPRIAVRLTLQALDMRRSFGSAIRV